MARVVAFVPDLLFGSNVQGMLVAAGHDVELVGDPAALGGRLAGADALVVDLTAEPEARIAAVPDGAPVTVGFYSHVEADVRSAALAAGFDVVVPRSRMAREGADVLAGALAGR